MPCHVACRAYAAAAAVHHGSGMRLPPALQGCCSQAPPRSAPPVPPLPRIERACLGTIAEGRYLTRDLGGKSGTSDFTRAIIGRLDD